MYKSYQSHTGVSNRLLKKRWDTTMYDTHKNRVTQAQSVIDNRAPKKYAHLDLKLNKLQIEEERLATVERDNRILLEKMASIMRTKGRVDNRNDYQQKSLNKAKRQRELIRVTHENEAILKRIAMKESNIKHLNWKEDWKNNQQYLDNIAKYPKEWYKDRKTKPNAKNENKHEEDGTQIDNQDDTGTSNDMLLDSDSSPVVANETPSAERVQVAEIVNQPDETEKNRLNSSKSKEEKLILPAI